MRLEDIPTPCLVLDRGILERNLRTMSATARRLGVALRPHLKTAKSVAVAQMAVKGEVGGITVSTLAEAEYFADHGFRDVTLAAALTPQKLGRAAKVTARGVALILVTDDPALASAIGMHGAPFRALVEVDSGDHRAGVAPDSASLLEIADALGDKLAGVMTHAGHSYACGDAACAKEVAEQERRAVVTAVGRLREAGHACDVVSVGSTPTITHAERLDGVTEARPGVYMFGDLFQAEIGSCSRNDIAVTVLASVIGRRPGENRILLDAGALALSKDRSTAVTDHDFGYGMVWDIEGRPTLGDCRIERADQEHGVATASEPLPFTDLPIGAKVRVAPNHACLTAAAYDRYYVVDGGADVTGTWDRVNGW